MKKDLVLSDALDTIFGLQALSLFELLLWGGKDLFGLHFAIAIHH